MTRASRRRTTTWLGRWGFGILVGLATIAAGCVASMVDPPPEIPSFALQAAAVYRLEVGAAIFAAAYLSATALVLALHNRAFSEIGMSGVKADDLSGSLTTIRHHQRELLLIFQILAELQAERDAEEPGMMTADDDE